MQRMLRPTTGLATDAATTALNAGKPVSDALSILELGRGVIAGLSIDTRGDLSDLRRAYPLLADRVDALRTELYLPLQNSGSVAELSMINRRHQASDELDEVIERIRAQDGFHDFLQPPSAESLMAAAVSGPIVVINLRTSAAPSTILGLFLSGSGLLFAGLVLTPPDAGKASSVSSSKASGLSRSTSPLKRQFLKLRLDATGVETKALTVEALTAIPNPEAASLLRIIRRISAYRGFLPDRLRNEILQNHKIEGSDLDAWGLAFKDSTTFDHLPGRIPSPAEIRLINEWTIEYVEFKHEEAGWNDEVHFPLLKAIFREPGEKGGGLFNITTCQTARPHKAWLPKSIGSKMVDIFVYADTAFKDNVSLQTHEAFCRSTLTKSVNHTEFHRLQIRPVVLSIETKSGSHSLDAADLQVGVWHACQWTFLRSSLIAVKRASTSGPPTRQELEQVDQALATLPFIPAVIVQGSRWLFVLSTRQGQNNVLWKEWQFGSTAMVMETYQVVAGLRQLAAWAEEVYLTWFQKEILAYYEPSPA